MEMGKLHWIPVLLAAVLWTLPAAGQSICFWTDRGDVLPVRIYVDQEYIGDVTAAFEREPLLDTEGALSVDTTPERHNLTAVDRYGRVYKGWPGYVSPKPGEVLFLRIRGGDFRDVDRSDAAYAFIFLNWNPIPFNGRYRARDLDPRQDSALLTGMAATAVGASAAGVSAAAVSSAATVT